MLKCDKCGKEMEVKDFSPDGGLCIDCFAAPPVCIGCGDSSPYDKNYVYPKIDNPDKSNFQVDERPLFDENYTKNEMLEIMKETTNEVFSDYEKYKMVFENKKEDTHSPPPEGLIYNPNNFEKSVDKEQGLRYNKGKNRTDLLPFDTLWHISKVLDVGSRKYADRNWEKGMSWMSVVGCLMRHLIKFVTGNNIDPETKLPHIDLVMINAIFLSRYYRKNKDFDDRPISETIED